MREKQSYRDNLVLLEQLYPDRATLTMADTAVVLGVDYKTIQRHRPTMPFVRIGRSYLISKADLARYISA